MKLNEFKTQLTRLDQVQFELPDKTKVPPHFHITEIGLIHKTYIDCGGQVRNEKKISMQLWEAEDFDHRLSPEKLLSIIGVSEKHLDLEDCEIEVEYQTTTINKFHLNYQNGIFLLENTYTDCLAKDKCGIPPEKIKKPLSSLSKTCTPGGGCC